MKEVSWLTSVIYNGLAALLLVQPVLAENDAAHKLSVIQRQFYANRTTHEVNVIVGREKKMKTPQEIVLDLRLELPDTREKLGRSVKKEEKMQLLRHEVELCRRLCRFSEALEAQRYYIDLQEMGGGSAASLDYLNLGKWLVEMSSLQEAQTVFKGLFKGITTGRTRIDGFEPLEVLGDLLVVTGDNGDAVKCYEFLIEKQESFLSKQRRDLSQLSDKAFKVCYQENFANIQQVRRKLATALWNNGKYCEFVWTSFIIFLTAIAG